MVKALRESSISLVRSSVSYGSNAWVMVSRTKFNMVVLVDGLVVLVCGVLGCVVAG